MAEAAVSTPEHASPRTQFKIPRLPGDIMIYPMIAGLLINTFCPQLLEIGGFFTAAARGGANTIVAAILLFVGAGISFKATPAAIKTGVVILIPKLVVATALGLVVAHVFNDNFLGLSSVAIISAISFCNMALYTGIMGEYGDEAERGAVGVLFFTAGPAVTMIILGVAGVASIPLGTIVGSILPLVIGIVLGNIFPFIRQLLTLGANPAIAVVGFQLGCGMSLTNFISGGISGILLGLIAFFVVGTITCVFERLLGGRGRAAVASSTVAGTAMTTPVALVEVSPAYAAIAPIAAAQIATAVIVTAVIAPILTGWYDKRFCKDTTEVAQSL
ncbi:2-keto-3-deoxygluconate permease [Collinsella sp. zg1085]|uniref:2-keto-3-deoxygluconate permease n=1 Tax=Collinsella sp. zg1085 TaxID=2844380 RepID=UPI001C0E5429|nr:2-keto-3-deoxygluconate permease [Collinsella sp. zg1085]QWT17280.1 2-keto-3-deoxygluconate permease [Collinsella sp. zg1085]